MKPSPAFFKNLALAFFASLLALSGAIAAEPTPTAVASTVPAAASTPYPLTICIVSGDKLGVMGPAVMEQYKGEEVRFCCKDCVKDFQKDPEKYMSRLHEAEAKQKANSGS